MKETKKLTVSAMTVALGIAVMFLGSIVDVIDLSVAAIASLLVMLIHVEIGKPYDILVWLCTSLAAFLCFPHSMLWLEYLLLFGLWPILKALVEKLPRLFWIPVKLVFFNVMLLACVGLAVFITGLPFFDGETTILNVLLYLLCNVAFFAYDFFITVMCRIYLLRFQKRISRLFH